MPTDGSLSIELPSVLGYLMKHFTGRPPPEPFDRPHRNMDACEKMGRYLREENKNARHVNSFFVEMRAASGGRSAAVHEQACRIPSVFVLEESCGKLEGALGLMEKISRGARLFNETVRAQLMKDRTIGIGVP